jgi:hypothetical protein
MAVLRGGFLGAAHISKINIRGGQALLQMLDFFGESRKILPDKSLDRPADAWYIGHGLALNGIEC